MQSLFLAVLWFVGSVNAASPVQKVVELLEESKKKVLHDLAAEEKEMAEYSQFCDDEVVSKTHALQTSSRKISELQAAVEDKSAQISKAQEEVSKLGTEVAGKESELASAGILRKKEKTDFQASEKELMTSIDALERAIIQVKRGTSFAQLPVDNQKGLKAALEVFANIVDAGRVTAGVHRHMQGLMQTVLEAGDGVDEYQKLGVHHQAQSGNSVLEAMEEMKEKTEETLSETRTTEMRQGHSFDLTSQSLGDSIKIANKEVAENKATAGVAGEELGAAKKELVAVEAAKAADEKYLQQLTIECHTSQKSWEDRQEAAHAEIEAIHKAVETLVNGVSLVQDPDDYEADASQDEPDDKMIEARRKAVQKLKDMSEKFGSFALMDVAGAATSDPFSKVKGLIEGMISKLVEQANAEASQKSFCDEETAKSKKAQGEKSLTLDKLNSRIETAAATKAQLQQAISDLQSDLAALDKGTAEATKIRGEEHATYLKESSDYKKAATAIEEATGVLKQYYAGAGAALLQQSAKGKQPSFGAPKTESAHVILAILEEAGVKFTKMLMKTEDTEVEAAKAFETLVQDNKVAKASKETEIKGAESEIKSLTVALQAGKEDASMTSKELDSVMEYLDKLKPQCEAKVMSYAEKKAKREQEIAGLKEVLEIMTESPALVQKHFRGIQKHA
jgi:flagellar biosynthesis chaperone FliJ